MHELGRTCRSSTNHRKGPALRRPIDLLESFAADFPSGRFRVDGEPGTTLALLIVVWNELKSCDPSMAAEVQDMIPAKYRGP